MIFDMVFDPNKHFLLDPFWHGRFCWFSNPPRISIDLDPDVYTYNYSDSPPPIRIFMKFRLVTTPQTMTFPTHFSHICCSIPPAISRPEWRPSSPSCCQLHMPFVHPPWHPPQQSSCSPATFNEDVDSCQQTPQGYRCSLWNPIHHVGEQISGKSGRFFSSRGCMLEWQT